MPTFTQSLTTMTETGIWSTNNLNTLTTSWQAGNQGNSNYGSWIGIRFTSVTVPQYARITSATLTMKGGGSGGGGSYPGVFKGVLSATTSAWSGAVAPWTSRLTTSSCPIGETLNNVVYNYDITTIIQDIINQSAWVSGNDMSIVTDTTDANGMAVWIEATVYSFTFTINYETAGANTKISELTRFAGVLSGKEIMMVGQTTTTKRVTVAEVMTPYPLASTTSPPTAPTYGVKLYGSEKAGRHRPAWLGPTNAVRESQCLLGDNKVGWWSATGNSIAAFNLAAGPGVSLLNFGHTVTGTATARNVAVTNQFTAARRIGYAIGAGTVAGTRYGLAQFTMRRGFEYIVRFGISGTIADASSYTVGIMSDVASNLNTMSFPTQGLMLKADYINSGSMTFEIFSSSPSVFNASKVGINTTNFPINTANVDLYEFRLYVPPGGLTANWRIERLNTGTVDQGSFTSDLPFLDTLLGPQVGCFGTASSGVAIDVVSQYIETDF